MKRIVIFIYAIIAPLWAFAADTTCPAGYQPSEYIELEYIESTGTQYIDTGVIADSNKAFEVTVKFLRDSALQNMGAYGYVSKTVHRLAVGLTLETNVQLTGAPGSSWFTGSKYDYTNSVILKTDAKNAEYYINNDRYAGTTGTSNVGLSLFLFKAHTSDERFTEAPCIARLYNSKIWDNNIIVRNFVPVKRNSDNAIGMYDTVNGKFYDNNGNGDFIAGPEVQSFIIDENGNTVCVSCPANTYKQNAGNEQCTKCPEHTFSLVGSTALSDCAKILRVKDYVVYMPLGKRTEHGLCTMLDGKKYCADVYERK